MRTKPLIGEKPWFGPPWLGWGVGPVSIEGWAATAAATVAARALAKRAAARGEDPKRAQRAPSLALLALVAVKGTPPGGRKAHRRLMAARAEAAGAR
jgi:hypothetical protein